MGNNPKVIFKTTSIYIWHLVGIIAVVAFSSTGFISDKGFKGFIIWLIFFLIISFSLFYNNKRIVFYQDKIIMTKAYFNKTLLIIPISSICKVEYADAFQARFDNEKIRITYVEERSSKRITKVLPLYMIKEDVLYELIENFRNAKIRTIVKSDKKVFTKKK
jgi:hypothetical protein